VQHRARQSNETGLEMGNLQPCANLCNAYCLTRNEQVSGSSPLFGSPNSAYLSRIREAPSSSLGTRRHHSSIHQVDRAQLVRYVIACRSACPPLARPQVSLASSMGPMTAHSACCLCGRGLGVLEGVRHRLLEGHRPSFCPGCLERLLVELSAGYSQAALVQGTPGRRSTISPTLPPWSSPRWLSPS
jgi:hypothetical protein